VATEIEFNQHYATLLGWTPEQLNGTAFDDALVQEIRGIQADLGLEVDGICGPMTYRALVTTWLTVERGLLTQAGESLTDRLAVAGRVAVLEAKRLWLEYIVEPPDGSLSHQRSRAVIDGFIRGEDGLGWDAPAYQQDGDFAWCGAFVARAWRVAGLRMDLRRTCFATPDRLDAYGRHLDWKDRTPDPKVSIAPRRWLQLDQHASPRDAMFSTEDPPREGDVLLVGGTKSAHGSHVCLVESYDLSAGTFTTLEGHATGTAPTGRRIDGVVRTRRPVGLSADAPPTTYHARRLIRPSLLDLG